jgi:hypothetical protein
LGDGYIIQKGNNGQASIQFNQGLIHLNYTLFVFKELQSICTHYPSLIRQRDGSFSLNITTRSLLCLNPFFDLFIVNGKKQFLTIFKNI